MARRHPQVPRITGYTKRAINQAISREGRGVATEAILDAARDPVKVLAGRGGAFKVIGKNATFIINKAGKVVTVWARNSAGARIVP